MKTFLVAVMIAVLSVKAEFSVAPNDRATQPGNSFTFTGFTDAFTIQSVYGPNNFSQPVFIDAIGFRVDEGGGGSFDAVIPRIRIRVSTYSGTFASFNPGAFAYEANKGPDDRTVFDGPVHWTATDFPGSAPNPFDLKLQFTQPFAYDPSKGALLVNYESFRPFTGGVIVDLHAHGDFSVGWMGTSAANLVTQFDVRPIPEPPVWALASLLIPALIFTRRQT